jgi:predicted dehydrogenase
LFITVIARLLSPLQHVKAAIRNQRKSRPGTNFRSDIPAFVSEVYFLISLLIVCTIYFTRPTNGPLVVVTLLTAVLTLETVTWLCYYLFVRAILERNYTIFHPAEYLILLPVVLGTQAFGVASLFDLPLAGVIDSLTGRGRVEGPIGFILNFLALFYLTVAITTLLSSYPDINARSSENLAIVGSGEVVQERILPALREACAYKPWEISILTTDLTAPTRLGGSRVIKGSSAELIRWLQAERIATIIATPTPSHLPYIRALADSGIPGACEKPLTLSAAELRELKAHPTLLSSILALSYYSMEKGLGLTYLLSRNPAHREFLEAYDPARPRLPGTLLPDEYVLERALQQLGGLTSVEVTLREGIDRSPTGSARVWTENTGRLLDLGETAIHPIVLLTHLIGTRTPLEIDAITTGIYEPRRKELELINATLSPTSVRVQARAQDVPIAFEVTKYCRTAEHRRTLVAMYENATLTADFDSRTLVVMDGSGRISLALRVLDAIPKYGVLMTLFRQQLLRAPQTGRVDDLDNQLRAIELWTGICEDGLVGAPISYGGITP